MSNTGGCSVPRIQVFRPSMEEFKNFSQYIAKIESEGAMKAGLAKIIPPEGWTPRKKGYDDIDLFIPAPISQVVTGRQGLYQQINIQQKGLFVKEFEKLANSNKYRTPSHFDYEDLERKYWKNITYNSPIYGADVSGSLYDADVDEFNIQRLNTILDMIKNDYEIQIEGVNTAYLYFGMWKTTFAWHTEDMDLYSINYLHFGAPKSWYVVPPEHGRRLERLAAGFFHGSHQNCAAFLRHKMTIISPQILKQYSIPFHKITQEPGEFMITFPFAYHSGFNHGFNCAESTNFALPRWVEYGKRSIPCTCRNDCVKICMDIFVKKFQPDIYELWKVGKDIGAHPEDPSRHYAAPPPKKYELVISAQREKRKIIKDQSLQKIKRHPISKLDKDEQIHSKKDPKLDPRDSDEDTELYDINETLPKKSIKKQVKKKCRSMSFSNQLKETKVKKERAEGIKMENVNGERLKVDLTEDEKDSLDENTFSENNLASLDVIMEEDNVKIKIEVAEEIVGSKESETEISDNDNSNAKGKGCKVEPCKTPEKITNDVLTSESPPKLKPFWAPEVKTPNTPEFKTFSTLEAKNLSSSEGSPLSSQDISATSTLKIINPPASDIAPNAVERNSYSTESSKSYIEEQMELLNVEFPHLKEAIDSGTFSVVPVSETIDKTLSTFDTQSTHSEKCLSPVHNAKSNKLFFPHSSIICKTWRCEQTNNGLKLKIIQPKNLVTPDKIESPCPYSPIEEPGSPPQKITRRSSLSDRSSIESCASPIKNRLSTESNNSPARRGRPRKGNKETPQKNADEDNQLNKTRNSSPGSSQGGPFVKIIRADSSLDSWAHPIRDLWQNKPKNFDAEIEFNEKLAGIPPYCAICVIFTPMYSKANFPTEPSIIPSYSSVRMPAYCYGNTLNSECMIDTNSLLRADGTAPLLVCSVCKVCVHATCYGISMLPSGCWTCTRCINQVSEAECCLCVLRGGALKPTTDKRWAHVICAILITEVYFENTSQKHPINVSKIPTKRQRLNCKYCIKTTVTKGTCVQCQSGKCYLPYHVTCGYMAGVIFESSDWPEPINMVCTRHVAARRKPPKRELTSISVGERVIAKNKNKRYYWANVKKKYIQEFYSILFEDNSHSTNTLPEDIVSRDVSIQGTPHINEKVQVKWTDGQIYNGMFKGSQSCELYVIEFDDGSVLHQERKLLYAADEDLPKEIQSKVSHSSERRDSIFEMESGGKRLRVSNNKYSSSYIQ